MGIATGFEGLAMLLPNLRHDIEEGGPIGRPRWVQWGYVNRQGTKEPIGWYLLVRLPIYSMQQSWWAQYNHDDRAEPVWHQAVLVFRERVPTGSLGGWRLMDWECLP